MIGSAGANVGKTELACEFIKRFGRDRYLIGIKVTTIKAKDGRCPRGVEGCGVCSSLDGDFYITEEADSISGKDTSRLLAAGAKRVFWLRVMRTHLEEGLVALLDVIGRDVVSICESNSLRNVVEPGLFLMVKSPPLGVLRSGSRVWKKSAQEVKKYADKIVASDSGGFDIELDRRKSVV